MKHCCLWLNHENNCLKLLPPVLRKLGATGQSLIISADPKCWTIGRIIENIPSCFTRLWMFHWITMVKSHSVSCCVRKGRVCQGCHWGTWLFSVPSSLDSEHTHSKPVPALGWGADGHGPSAQALQESCLHQQSPCEAQHRAITPAQL